MTAPTIYPAKYTGTDSDYLIAPGNRNGGLQLEPFSVSVASGTASSVVVGLQPFTKGCRFAHGAFAANLTDMDTDSDLTLDFGYVYDDNVTYTDDPNAFATQITTGQAGGLVTLDEPLALSFLAEANGWFVMVVGVGGVAGTTPVVSGQIVFSYEG